METKNNLSLIVANWKMNQTISTVNSFLDQLLLSKLNLSNVIICPSYTLLSTVKNKLNESNVSMGAQDCSSFAYDNGAYTGDISTNMLKDIGCDYVIIGHSERRKNHLEDDDTINNKIKNAHKAGLKVILCVGENLNDRENGNYLQTVAHQLINGLADIPNIDNIIIAYEPVWAIGTSKVASEQQIEEMHEFLTKTIKDLYLTSQVFDQIPKIIYGGSVNQENAAKILALNYVSGLLVGGASLNIEKFCKIILERNTIKGKSCN